MKKSKFLKSSKDMLHRSFNPSKCKTSLRLAGSRLKLLRNKKDVQVKQMKREIAQLLESGQNQTARIRVEHVIREEKMMTAYDLIELYCELIVARLPIIETQKVCPIDLKEAITSVIFASPRCGDVPELIDIKKQFTDKYGKEFITAAVELRPGCGVSRLVVEKLSAVAPDGPTKIKMLSAIAEEHNVKWDSNSFSESSVPANDLLHGQSTFGEESKLHAEPSHFEGPVQHVPQSNNNRVHDSPSNLTHLDNRTSQEAERLASTKSSGINSYFQHKERPPDDERSQYFQGDRQRWKMEFKDATAAAQAAAESAELASMAARAAAELSGREAHMNSRFSSGQSFQESKNTSFPQHTRSQNEQMDRMQHNNRKTVEGFKNTSFDDRKESTQSASLPSFKDMSRDGRKESTQSASLKSQSSLDDNSFYHHVPVVDENPRKSSLKEVPRGGTSMQRESFKHKSENVREERIGKQPNARSSNSHTSISDDVNIFSNSKDQNYEYGAGEDSFLDFEKKGIYKEASQTDSRESADVFFDKSESESENQGFDMSPKYDEPKQRFHMPLSDQKPHDWSPRSSTSKTVKSSSSLFHTRKSSSTDSSERSSKHDDSGPVIFDQSDVPTSESDEEMNLSRHPSNSKDIPSTQNHSIGSTSESEEETNISRHPMISTDYFSTQNQSVGSQFKDKNELSVGSSLKEKSPRKQSSLEETEIEEGLNLGKLTGGFRHKGYNNPPYLKNRFDVSSSNKESEENTATIPKSTVVESSRMIKKPRTPYLQSESDSDNSVKEEFLRKSPDHEQARHAPTIGKNAKTKPSLAASTSVLGSDNSDSDEDRPKESFSRYRSPDHKQERHVPTIGKNAKTKPSLAASTSVFGSDNSDSDEDRPKESFSRYRGPDQKQESYAPTIGKNVKTKPSLAASTAFGSDTSDSDESLPKESSSRYSHLRGGVSRRTKAFPSSSGKLNYSKMQQNRSETLDSDDDMNRKATTSTISETVKRPESQRNSNKLEHFRQPASRKEASEPIKEKQSLEKNQESKVSLKSSAIKESSTHQIKMGASISRENPTLDKTSSNKDGSNQSASHVHPKLPDYDNFVQLFQKNRS